MMRVRVGVIISNWSRVRWVVPEFCNSPKTTEKAEPPPPHPKGPKMSKLVPQPSGLVESSCIIAIWWGFLGC